MAHQLPIKDPKRKKQMANDEFDPNYSPSASTKNASLDSLVNPRKKQKSLQNEVQDVKSSQRVWNETDEVALLQGMIHYSSTRNADPSVDYEALLNFIKDNLTVEVTKKQLKEKVGRMRKKYKINVAKRNMHDELIFQRSDKIWGTDDKMKGTAKAAGVVDEENKMRSSLVLRGASAADLEDWFRKNPDLISEEKKNEMLNKLKALEIAKVKVYLKELKVMHKLAKAVSDAVEASPQ